MGFLRKAAIVSTGGAARVAVNPNSKKARTAKANEKMLKLQEKEAKLRAAEAKSTAAAQRKAASAAQRNTSLLAAPAATSADAQPRPGVVGLAQPAMSVADELEKLAALRDAGVLTAEEFDTQKAKTLNSFPR